LGTRIKGSDCSFGIAFSLQLGLTRAPSKRRAIYKWTKSYSGLKTGVPAVGLRIPEMRLLTLIVPRLRNRGSKVDGLFAGIGLAASDVEILGVSRCDRALCWTHNPGWQVQ